jgi:hypothetical protein
LLDRGLTTGFYGVPTAMGYVAVNWRFVAVECCVPFSEVTGTRSIYDGLDHFVCLTVSVLEQLLIRGRQYAKLGSLPCSFMEYTDGSFVPAPKAGLNGNCSVTSALGSGCLMVDSQAALLRGVHGARAEGDAADAVRGVMKLIAQRSRMNGSSFTSSSGDMYTAGSGGQSESQVEDESQTPTYCCRNYYFLT